MRLLYGEIILANITIFGLVVTLLEIHGEVQSKLIFLVGVVPTDQ